MATPAAAPDDADGDILEGAGVVSSVHDLAGAVQEQDAAGIAAAGTAAGLDALGAVADPLGAFAEAGLGWAMEHVSWLREPLDQLCGDPGEIEGRARAWQALARSLTERATELDESVRRAAQGWSGAAADGYLDGASARRAELVRVAGTAGEVARLVLESGVMVGTERAVIRDAIASFVVTAVRWLAVALGTGGVGAPAAVTALVADAAVTASNMADGVAAVLRELGRLSRLADELAAGLGPAGLRAAGGLEAALGAVPGLGVGVEAAKQDAAGRVTEREWDAPAG
ncbi:hypothetical protein ACLFMI_05800 [Pseudonocardia nantongensis]|uniref:WXG100-like domain-containing protein n=1 Tax=Pseudonocardia nantongensis TaxID=1181885 RepID=UPI00397AD69F